MQAPEPTQAETENRNDEQPFPDAPQNVGSAPFSVLVGLYEKLSNERKLDRRMKVLNAWFTHWRQEVGNDLYPVLRLLLPQKDRERSVYGLKEKVLAKTYIKLIPLQMRDPDAIRLLNWKKPSEKDKASGDFPTVLYDVVSKRSSVIEGSLSIQELNDLLDELSKSMNKGDVQFKILQRIYNRTTPDEQRWIARIILKDMVISVKETTVFSVFHPDAQDLYNTCSDLKRVAWTLWDPSFKLDSADKNVRLFHSFAPMLCKRPTKTIDETVKFMGGTEFYIEEKLDGERIQLHKRGNEFFYCSRKGKDYTYLYGKHVGTGSLTPHIAKAFDERVDDIILDGEMLVWDPITQRNLPFGTLKTAALDKSKKEHNPRPCFKIFDLLYLNGHSLLDKSTSFRKNNMRNCVKEIMGRIEYATEYKGKTAQDVRAKMEDIMEARGEGLVIKHPRAKYILNGRNQDWIKVKPEYMDNMGETVDVLVVAGDYGSGSRGGGVSTLICAVLDDRQGGSILDDNPTYSTFVRIGSGLSFVDYVWVRAKPWKTWDPKNPPAFLKTAKKGIEDKGDVYLEPQDSFILKVKAAEIVTTTQYHLGYTMRFPRALSIRDDLSIADCMTATEILEHIRSDKKRKMDTDVSAPRKKQKTIVTKKAKMLTDYSGEKLRTVPVETDIFEGLKFFVMRDDSSRNAGQELNDMTKLIHVNGGTLTQSTKNQPQLFVVYGGKTIPYDLQLIINKDTYDVIKPSWVKDSVESSKQVPLTKKYFFHATGSRKETEEYLQDGDEEDQDVKDDVKQEDEATDDEPITHRATSTELEVKEDAPFAEWFKVEHEDKVVPKQEDNSDTEPDDDSDNNDIVNADQGVADDLDGWEHVKSEDEPKDEDVKMGETDTAMDYDQDLIFKHLCFYLDTPANAKKYGMSIKAKYEKDLDESFAALSKIIEENGGRIVDLDEPKMTHVVIDKRDDSRRRELLKRTSKPKRRHLVISEFVQACLEEKTLLDEEEFAP